jgi:hypothetical protein
MAIFMGPVATIKKLCQQLEAVLLNGLVSSMSVPVKETLNKLISFMTLGFAQEGVGQGHPEFIEGLNQGFLNLFSCSQRNR